MISDRETLERRRRDFEEMLRAQEPQGAAAKLAVVDRLVEVCSRNPVVDVCTAHNADPSVGFRFRASDLMLWRASPGGPRSVAKVVLLDCRPPRESDVCRETRSRVNDLRVADPLTERQEIAMSLDELCDPETLEHFVMILTDLIRSIDPDRRREQE